MIAIVKEEPVLISTAVAAAITLAVAFGAPIDEGQKSAILGFVAAGLTLAAGIIARNQVTPVASAQRKADLAYTNGFDAGERGALLGKR